MRDQAASLHQMVRRNDVEGVCEFLARHRLPRASSRASQTSKMGSESSAVPSDLKRRRRIEDAEEPRKSLQGQNKGKDVSCRRPLLPDSKTSVTSTTDNDVTEAAYNVINRRNSLGRTPLHMAACFQRVDIARMLVQAGCDVTAADGQGRHALHEAVMKACPDMVRVLLDSGRCDLEAVTSEGTTPLILAATYDYVDITRLLVRAGAKFESRDTEGGHCLHVALEEGSEACAVYFIQAGCDVNALDRKGRSCLHLATHSSHLFSTRVIQALLTSGYDFEKDEAWLRQERQPSVFYNAQPLYHQVLRKAGIDSAPPTTRDDPHLTPVAVSPSEGIST